MQHIQTPQTGLSTRVRANMHIITIQNIPPVCLSKLHHIPASANPLSLGESTPGWGKAPRSTPHFQPLTPSSLSWSNNTIVREGTGQALWLDGNKPGHCQQHFRCSGCLGSLTSATIALVFFLFPLTPLALTSLCCLFPFPEGILWGIWKNRICACLLVLLSLQSPQVLKEIYRLNLLEQK